MKITTKIDEKDVTIVLTKEQLEEIRKQTENNIDDINSYEDACRILSRTPQTQYQFSYWSDWYFHQLRTVIEAVNFIDNGYKDWQLNWDDRKEHKYYPYFEKISGDWSVPDVRDVCLSAYLPGGLYFKSKESAEIIANRFLELYSKIRG